MVLPTEADRQEGQERRETRDLVHHGTVPGGDHQTMGQALELSRHYSDCTSTLSHRQALPRPSNEDAQSKKMSELNPGLGWGTLESGIVQTAASMKDKMKWPEKQEARHS